MKKRYSIYIIFFLYTFAFNKTEAQTTIGSTEQSALGALLDLKEEGDTKKGLGLPRVILKSLEIPNNGIDLSATVQNANPNGNTPWDKKAHTGLLVYHAGEYDICDPFSLLQGLYVWDGDEWQYIGEKKERSPLVHQMKDSRDGEIYLYRNFGAAGDWMLVNMRHIPTWATPGAQAGDPTDKLYSYPNASFDDPAKVPDTWRPNQGLIYTYSAATAGVQDEQEDDIKNEGGQGHDRENQDPSFIHPIIQGVCPDGWHIPSDKEWNILEKEIYNHPEIYSNYTLTDGQSPFVPAQWADQWNEIDDPRGSENAEGHGKALRSPCAPVGSNNPSEGVSSFALDGGFDILFTGSITEEPTESMYGYAGYLWSSSIGVNDGVWSRLFHKDDQRPGQVVRHHVTNAGFQSVRCKR